jgi:hypothetical protein
MCAYVAVLSIRVNAHTQWLAEVQKPLNNTCTRCVVRKLRDLVYHDLPTTGVAISFNRAPSSDRAQLDVIMQVQHT